MAENKAHLLLVEDETALRTAIADQLAEAGFHVVQAHSGEEAVLALTQFAFDLVLTDLRLPGVGGGDVLAAALERYPDIIVIVMTGYGTVRDAVASIKRGATDFIAKPFQSDELLHVLNGALEQRRLRTENAYLRSQLQDRYRFDGLIGQSRAMRELFELLGTVAATPSTILIGGETGTGKELVARAIHHNSPRRHQHFVAINCGALPETLLEAELFGYVRGAFTGAVGQRMGRLEQAHRGTLFLDEVGTMSPGLQTRLLRVLQEREFERVGESKPTRIDVRIIAATNSDLAKMVRDGAFREDLFYRLNVIPIRMPALRERREDVPLLAQHFLDRLGQESDPPRTGVSFSQEALRRLMAHDWPGNVRQLENAVERALTFTAGRTQIDVTALPADVQASGVPAAAAPVLPDAGFDLESYIGGLERELITQSLERTGGNRRQAATLLGLKRTTLVEKLKRMERAR
jgi:DNA-binding NtrC family response regulator